MPASKKDLSKSKLATSKDLERASVSLKEDRIPSTKDVLDVISYFEKRKGLESYRDMIDYLDTTSVESLDGHLREIGLTSPDAVKKVVEGIEGLGKLNTGFEHLSKNLNLVVPRSNYLSDLSKAITPLSDLSKIIAPLADLSKIISPIETGSIFSKELQDSLKRSQQIQESSTIGKALQDSLRQLPKIQVGLPVSELQLDALKGLQEQLKNLQPIATGWQQAIQQIQPIRFEPFLPLKQLSGIRELEAAPKLDQPVRRFVETLEATEDELAKTAQVVSKIVKPKPLKIGVTEQKLLQDVYELSRQRTGQPNTSATFQVFEPGDVKKLEIAQFLADIGLLELKDDNRSLSITKKGIEFVKKISGRAPRSRAVSPQLDEFARTIFLAYGKDDKMKNQVQGGIEDMGIRCEVLEDGYLPGHTIIEKFLESCKDKDCAVVLVTPDDLCCDEIQLEGKKRDTSDHAEGTNEWKRRKRARQNVIWEIGFFYGKFTRERTIIVHKENDKFEWPSNIDSTDYVPFNPQWKEKVALALTRCGYEVNYEKVNKH